MDFIKLCNNGPLISRIGLGCMSMSAHYEPERDDVLSIQTIQEAYKSGINIFDTADMYGEGTNEILLGKALQKELKDKRKDIVIATKCGFVRTSQGGWSINLSPDHIKQACQSSLERLGLTYIDLYYLHRLPAGGVEPLKASLDSLIDLIKQEKIKYIGLSEADVESIRYANSYLREKGFPNALAAIQSEFSLFTQDPLKNGVLATCKELGIGFIPYSPLSRGLLTEKIKNDIKFSPGDVRQYFPRFKGDNLKNNLIIRDKLSQFSKKKGCTITQLALAWLLAQGNFIVPIPGTRTIQNLKNNIDALSIVLTQNDLSEIDKIFISLNVQGERYPEQLYELENIKRT